MAAFSLASLAVGLPPLDQGREEARFVQAYLQTLAIQKGQLSAETLDPWGSPYRTTEDEGTIIRVGSPGPNTTSPTNGFDNDDIWSDMTDPPHLRFERTRQRRLVLSLVMAASPWLIVIVRRLIASIRLRQHGSRR